MKEKEELARKRDLKAQHVMLEIAKLSTDYGENEIKRLKEIHKIAKRYLEEHHPSLFDEST